MDFLIEIIALHLGGYIRWNITGRNGEFSEFLSERKLYWVDAIVSIIVTIIVALILYKLDSHFSGHK